MIAAAVTASELIASASKILEGGGYRTVDDDSGSWRSTNSRLFENAYSVVGVVVFDTCSELISGWPDRQGQLVDVISRYVGKGEAKAWDGYLVLLTPGFATSAAEDLEAVRRDTARLRKLVAAGDDLAQPGGVERVLRSLLPLNASVQGATALSALDQLVDVLAHGGIDRRDARALTEAFLDQRPLLESLHRTREVP